MQALKWIVIAENGLQGLVGQDYVVGRDAVVRESVDGVLQTAIRMRNDLVKRLIPEQVSDADRLVADWRRSGLAR